MKKQRPSAPPTPIRSSWSVPSQYVRDPFATTEDGSIPERVSRRERDAVWAQERARRTGARPAHTDAFNVIDDAYARRTRPTFQRKAAR